MTAARARVAFARVGVGIKTRVGKEKKAMYVDTLVFRAGEVIIRAWMPCAQGVLVLLCPFAWLHRGDVSVLSPSLLLWQHQDSVYGPREECGKE